MKTILAVLAFAMALTAVEWMRPPDYPINNIYQIQPVMPIPPVTAPVRRADPRILV